jgi:hypothetical protein
MVVFGRVFTSSVLIIYLSTALITTSVGRVVIALVANTVTAWSLCIQPVVVVTLIVSQFIPNEFNLSKWEP